MGNLKRNKGGNFSMVNIGANGQKTAYGIKHYILDQVGDIADIDKRFVSAGSTAFVIATSQYFMLNGNKQWKEINPYGLGGSSSGDEPGGGGGSEPEEDY